MPREDWKPSDEWELRDWGMRAAEALKDRAKRWIDPIIDPDKQAIEQARLYLVLRDIADAFEDAVKSLTGPKDKLKTLIVPEAFDRDKAKTLTITAPFDNSGNYRITTSAKLRASITKDKREAAHEWLRSNNLGPLIVETVNAETLSAAARALADDGKELPEDIFTTYYQNSTSVTRVRV